MASGPISSQPPSALTLLQSTFALIRIGGEIRVIDMNELTKLKTSSGPRALSLYKRSEASLLMRRLLEAKPIPCKPRAVIEDFAVHPVTKVFDCIAFDPRPTPPETLNLWVPSPVKPLPGDWSILLSFLVNVICNGEAQVADYLLRYLAHMLQRPEEKPGVMPVLLGGQGTGKGTFFQLLRAIWPSTTLQVSDVGHITGGFNAALECNFVICLDEAIFKGDRKALDRMKSLITEPEITIEAKYQPRRSLASVHRFFAASNHQHFAHVESDDRRFLFLRVSDTRKGDHAYFHTVHAAVSDPAIIAAFVHKLLACDLSDFNVRRRPHTAEHLEQKLHSLTDFDRYWFQVLTTGDLSPSMTPGDPWSGARFAPSIVLTTAYNAFGAATRHAGGFTERDLADTLKRLCPSAQHGRRSQHGSQHRGHFLPTLADARGEFERAIGEVIQWPP